MSKNTCHCIFLHATTEAEIVIARQNVEYFRSVGDMRGASVTLMSLQRCPTAPKALPHNRSLNMKEKA